MQSFAKLLLTLIACIQTAHGSTSHRETQIIDTEHVMDFHCPKNTNTNLSLNDLQVEMDRFAHIFYVEKNVAGAFNQYVATNYVQHNPDILDGRNAAIRSLGTLFNAKENSFRVWPALYSLLIRGLTKI